MGPRSGFSTNTHWVELLGSHYHLVCDNVSQEDLAVTCGESPHYSSSDITAILRRWRAHKREDRLETLKTLAAHPRTRVNPHTHGFSQPSVMPVLRDLVSTGHTSTGHTSSAQAHTVQTNYTHKIRWGRVKVT